MLGETLVGSTDGLCYLWRTPFMLIKWLAWRPVYVRLLENLGLVFGFELEGWWISPCRLGCAWMDIKKNKGIQTRWSLWLMLLFIVETELICVEAVSQTNRTLALFLYSRLRLVQMGRVFADLFHALPWSFTVQRSYVWLACLRKGGSLKRFWSGDRDVSGWT